LTVDAAKSPRPLAAMSAPSPVLWALMSAGIMASGAVPRGRYPDRSVRVHDAAQLNPLRQVLDLRLSDRMSVGSALQTALAETGSRGIPLRMSADCSIPESQFRIPGLSKSVSTP